MTTYNYVLLVPFNWSWVSNNATKNKTEENYFKFTLVRVLLLLPHGRDRVAVGFTTLPMPLVPITTVVVSSNLDQGEVHTIIW
jgi:hypothetical protein